MKSILKQVLTVVLLLSVPAVFAGEQASFAAKAKAKLAAAGTYVAESRPGKFVAEKSHAAYDYAKGTRLAQWTFKEGDSKLVRTGKVTGVLAATAALIYGAVKLTQKAKAAYRNYTAKNKSAGLEVVKEASKAAAVVAPAKTAEQLKDEEVARIYNANVGALKALNAGA